MNARDRCQSERDHEWEHIDDDEDEEGPFAVLECQRCGRIRKTS